MPGNEEVADFSSLCCVLGEFQQGLKLWKPRQGRCPGMQVTRGNVPVSSLKVYRGRRSCFGRRVLKKGSF